MEIHLNMIFTLVECLIASNDVAHIFACCHGGGGSVCMPCGACVMNM